MEIDQENLDYLIVIPIFNEAKILGQSLELLFSYLKDQWSKHDSNWKIVVADNGSTDNAQLAIQNLLSKYEKNLAYVYIKQAGKGNALRTVLSSYQAKYSLYLDVDIPVAPSDIARFFEQLESGSVDIIAGKRQMGKRPLPRKILTFILRMFNKILFNLDIHDSQCGIKAFDRKAADLMVSKCTEDGYFLDTEILVKAKKQGLKISEVAIDWIEQRYESRASKTHLFRDSIRALQALARLAGFLS